jgi:YidC/Oxa1 family membrane protein insertase
VRIVLIPLFVKQIHASRKMQLIQPEMQKIQAKYKGKTDPESRQAMTQETMDLYKKTGTNPFSSCLPILLQSPFFFALFTVLNGLKAIAEGTTDRSGRSPRGAPQIEKSSSSVRRSPRPSSGRRLAHQDRHRRAHRAHVGDDVHSRSAS